mgnify:CR=1 FL=1
MGASLHGGVAGFVAQGGDAVELLESAAERGSEFRPGGSIVLAQQVVEAQRVGLGLESQLVGHRSVLGIG